MYIQIKRINMNLSNQVQSNPLLNQPQPKSATIHSGYMASAEMSEPSSDYYESKKLLLKSIMIECEITEDDLHNISIVKSKMREKRINTIID